MNLMAVFDLRTIRCARWGNLLEEVVASLWINGVTPIVTRYSLADKSPTVTNRFHSGEQFTSGMCFYDVAHCPQAECCLRHIDRRFLTHEKYFAFRAELADSSSHFNPIKAGKPDVEHDQVRFQFF